MITEVKIIGNDESFKCNPQLSIEVVFSTLKSKHSDFVEMNKPFTSSHVRKFLNDFLEKYFSSDCVKIKDSLDELEIIKEFCEIIDKSKIPFIKYNFVVQGKTFIN